MWQGSRWFLLNLGIFFLLLEFILMRSHIRSFRDSFFFVLSLIEIVLFLFFLFLFPEWLIFFPITRYWIIPGLSWHIQIFKLILCLMSQWWSPSSLDILQWRINLKSSLIYRISEILRIIALHIPNILLVFRDRRFTKWHIVNSVIFRPEHFKVLQGLEEISSRCEFLCRSLRYNLSKFPDTCISRYWINHFDSRSSRRMRVFHRGVSSIATIATAAQMHKERAKDTIMAVVYIRTINKDQYYRIIDIIMQSLKTKK